MTTYPYRGFVLVALLGASLLTGCDTRRDGDSKPALKISSLKPEVAGVSSPSVVPITLHNSLEGLKDGRLGAAVSLSSLPRGPGLVGIGSLSGLRGEVAIVDGAIWVSYPEADGIRAERLEQRDELAAFLATADVRAWTAESLDRPIAHERVQTEIERVLAKTNLDRSRPVPVVIEGEFSALKFNVVDGSKLTNDQPSREDMLRTAKTLDLPRAKGTLVGFYSQRDQPELIHPGQRTHLHVVLPEANQMGHVDAVTIEPGARLRLPEG